ncbi:DNA-binding transcriptional regulator, MarR family [Paramaledivibacter caminithermalis DSM 15212]|uniref:HTH-type transcriptional regulator SarZ n=1 Tax=Paramaledivibacter caminithermalis (strain DSM 15212 / CIP 107654 / DViRD3) TaxID=1121301 RepID=A0A1M6Q8H7_PARC5|nr:DNA-binding transcriptional regulator, MarR family [Paramaledivibacter caminithermalis DSM 15212]
MGDVVANYYNEINKMMEKIIYKVFVLNKKGLTFGKKNKELSILDAFIIKKIGSANEKSIYSLVKEIEIDRGVIASIINKLLANGYIIKQKSKEDKRINMVLLTEEGKEIYDIIMERQKEFFDFVLNDVTLNEEKAILKFLSKIHQKS